MGPVCPQLPGGFKLFIPHSLLGLVSPSFWSVLSVFGTTDCSPPSLTVGFLWDTEGWDPPSLRGLLSPGIGLASPCAGSWSLFTEGLRGSPVSLFYRFGLQRWDLNCSRPPAAPDRKSAGGLRVAVGLPSSPPPACRPWTTLTCSVTSTSLLGLINRRCPCSGSCRGPGGAGHWSQREPVLVSRDSRYRFLAHAILEELELQGWRGLWQVRRHVGPGCQRWASALRDGLGTEACMGEAIRSGHLGLTLQCPRCPGQPTHRRLLSHGLQDQTCRDLAVRPHCCSPLSPQDPASPQSSLGGRLPRQTWSTSHSLGAVCGVIGQQAVGADPHVLQLGSRAKGRTLTPRGSATATVNNR